MDPAQRRKILRRAGRYINAEGFWGQTIAMPDNRYLWQPYLWMPPPNFWRSGERWKWPGWPSRGETNPWHDSLLGYKAGQETPATPL